ncbi:MAG: LytTR family DNA-binding domain-containing protein [Lachnospiraceae bacterium]|jgi:DNA-binding LytR/AlgR family response regulator|nr:LytTR family DNA-binding domain-containing protein [Lachnospiraceae bacterium]
MITIAICDNAEMMASQIENLIYEICNHEKIAVDIDIFPSLESMAKEVSTSFRYDIVFLDLHIMNEDHMLLVENIRRADEHLLIVFMSNNQYYSPELMRLDALTIKKPIEPINFTNVFLQLYQKIRIKSHYFIFQYKNIYYKIPYKEILYFESRERKIHVITQYGTTEIFNGKLSAVEFRVARGSTPFVRIHQSFLVNYHLIMAKATDNVTLINGLRLPISEDRKKSFGQEYRKLLHHEMPI